MKVLFSAFVAALGLLFGLLPGALAAPSDYHFHLVADTGGPFQDFYGIAMNNRGAIAFSAARKDGGVGVYVRHMNGALTTILRDGAARRGVSINDAGTVAFSRESPFGGDSGGGLFTGAGGPVSTIVSEGTITGWAINNRGSVAFNRYFGPDDNAIFFAGKGRITQVPDSRSGDYPFINNSDLVLFHFNSTFGMQLLTSRAGARPTVVLDSETGPLWNFSIASMNDRGVIVFAALAGDGEQAGLYAIADGRLTTLADTRGPFNGFWHSAVNKRGAVAFMAYLDAGGIGIFTGPDAVADKVVAEGDPLFGSTVSELLFPGFPREWLNNGGEIAFIARLADGRQVIVRACPK